MNNFDDEYVMTIDGGMPDETGPFHYLSVSEPPIKSRLDSEPVPASCQPAPSQKCGARQPGQADGR